MAIFHTENLPLPLASIRYQDDLFVSKIMAAVVENLTHPLKHWNLYYHMFGLLMRYYRYCADDTLDLDVDLMFLNVIQFDCAHLTLY